MEQNIMSDCRHDRDLVLHSVQNIILQIYSEMCSQCVMTEQNRFNSNVKELMEKRGGEDVQEEEIPY